MITNKIKTEILSDRNFFARSHVVPGKMFSQAKQRSSARGQGNRSDRCTISAMRRTPDKEYFYDQQALNKAISLLQYLAIPRKIIGKALTSLQGLSEGSASSANREIELMYRELDLLDQTSQGIKNCAQSDVSALIQLNEEERACLSRIFTKKIYVVVDHYLLTHQLINYSQNDRYAKNHLSKTDDSNDPKTVKHASLCDPQNYNAQDLNALINIVVEEGKVIDNIVCKLQHASENVLKKASNQAATRNGIKSSLSSLKISDIAGKLLALHADIPNELRTTHMLANRQYLLD